MQIEWKHTNFILPFERSRREKRNLKKLVLNGKEKMGKKWNRFGNKLTSYESPIFGLRVFFCWFPLGSHQKPSFKWNDCECLWMTLYVYSGKQKTSYAKREATARRRKKHAKTNSQCLALSFDHREIALCRAVPLAICILFYTFIRRTMFRHDQRIILARDIQNCSYSSQKSAKETANTKSKEDGKTKLSAQCKLRLRVNAKPKLEPALRPIKINSIINKII